MVTLNLQNKDGKVCSTCKVWKTVGEFYKRTRSKDGLSVKCKVCSKEYDAKYYIEHQEEHHQKGIQYRIDNVDKLREYERVRYAEEGHRYKDLNYPQKFYENNKERILEREREPENSQRHKDLALQRNYGITLEQYDSMLIAQGGHCAICPATEPGGRFKYFCVDHNHTTSKVRGLLCNNCNRAIGLLKDSPVLLRAAAIYLEKE